jgi:surfactin synthase thioesterase subunit
MSVSSSSSAWVRRFRPSADSDFRLVGFPHAGGSASYYYPLSAALAPRVETLAVQYPGRQDRRSEKCLDNIPDLADEAFAALRGWTDRPFVFFGHSLGSILAFEVARRLEEAGEGPLWLFASGYPAPSRLRGGTVHQRDDAGLVDELLTAGGTDPRWLADEELLATILPAVRSDYRAIETHSRQYGALSCPITMFVGDADPQTTADEADAWRAHTSGSFDLRVFPGGHFYLDKHQAAIAEAILTTTKLALPARSGGAR